VLLLLYIFLSLQVHIGFSGLRGVAQVVAQVVYCQGAEIQKSNNFQEYPTKNRQTEKPGTSKNF
jgi:hypothetical protein